MKVLAAFLFKVLIGTHNPFFGNCTKSANAIKRWVYFIDVPTNTDIYTFDTNCAIS